MPSSRAAAGFLGGVWPCSWSGQLASRRECYLNHGSVLMRRGFSGRRARDQQHFIIASQWTLAPGEAPQSEDICAGVRARSCVHRALPFGTRRERAGSYIYQFL